MPTATLVIDGTNLDHQLWESFHRSDVDFTRFFAKLAGRFDLRHVHYCTANYIQSIDRDRYARQRAAIVYLSGRKDLVTMHFGKHKHREHRCQGCRRVFSHYHEKGTDVAAATNLVSTVLRKEVDRVVLVSNDTDYEPAIRACVGSSCSLALGYVVNPCKPLNQQRYPLDQMRKLVQDVIEIDVDWIEECWRPPTAASRR